MNHDDRNIEKNEPNRQNDAHVEELIEIGKTMIKISDSISVDVLLRGLEQSQERDNIQKQIHYLTTEFEKTKKQLNKDSTQ